MADSEGVNFPPVDRFGKSCLLILACAGRVALAQPSQGAKPFGIIDGLVSDSALAPLGDVTVSVLGMSAIVVTGENGRFRILDVPAGKHRLLMRRIGSEAVLAAIEVGAADTSRISIVLSPLITQLAGVRVTGTNLSPKLQEFDQRRMSGEGQFLTAEQITKRNFVTVEGLLAGGFRGIRVGSGGVILNGRFPITKPCPLDYYVDGLPRPRGDLPSPQEVAGIELYLGPATMPLQFKRPTGVWCGIVMIWLKDGSRP